MSLQFDPGAHAYHLDGVRLPNVTSILDPLVDYSGIPKKIMQAARERGDYVHKMCEMYVWGMLDEDEVVPEYKPYLEAFKKFLAETQFEAVHVEERVWHKALRYAGTLDLGGYFRNNKKQPLVLIDIKSTFRMMASIGPQTAAYQEAFNSHRPKPEHFKERMGLRLTMAGTYQLLPCSDTHDFTVFRSCLNLYHFMQKGKYHV